jgi:predicted transcriptional regulator
MPSHDGRDTFRISPEEKQKLLQSIAEADRGEFVEAEQLLAELDDPE